MNLDPVWLWPVAVIVFILLVPLTVWAYLGNKVPFRRIAGVVLLRLLAFVLAFSPFCGRTTPGATRIGSGKRCSSSSTGRGAWAM